MEAVAVDEALRTEVTIDNQSGNLSEDKPLYQQVRDRIRAALIDGAWKPGDLLPTETELSGQFGVSLGTVRRAVLTLVSEGLLTRKAGKGTFVAQISGPKSFYRFFRFRDAKTGEDFWPEVRLLKSEIITDVEPKVLELLGASPSESVLVLKRLLLRDETPVCVYTAYFRQALVPKLEFESLTNRLYPALESGYGIKILRAEEFLRAGFADSATAELLAIEAGAAILEIERRIFTYNDKVVEYRLVSGRTDLFRYKVQL